MITSMSPLFRSLLIATALCAVPAGAGCGNSHQPGATGGTGGGVGGSSGIGGTSGAFARQEVVADTLTGPVDLAIAENGDVYIAVLGPLNSTGGPVEGSIVSVPGGVAGASQVLATGLAQVACCDAASLQVNGAAASTSSLLPAQPVFGAASARG